MIVALLLASLALFDATLAGTRAALGRDGRIDKRSYVLRALARAVAWSAAVVAAVATATAATVATAPDPSATWRELVEAGRVCLCVFGAFAAVTLCALVVLLSPLRDHRVLASMVVFGPLTMLRPVVVVVGLGFAASRSPDARVWLVAMLGAGVLLGFERWMGRAYADSWRRLQR